MSIYSLPVELRGEIAQFSDHPNLSELSKRFKLPHRIRINAIYQKLIRSGFVGIKLPQDRHAPDFFEKRYQIQFRYIAKLNKNLMWDLSLKEIEEMKAKGGVLSAPRLIEMHKYVERKNQNHALLAMWDKILAELGDVAIERDPAAIREWMRNPHNQERLGRITSLSLWHKKLKVIPPEIKYLVGLQKLDLFFNQIEVIPPEIKYLVNLKRLKLTKNKIKVIPPEIKHLENLRDLLLHSNRIEVIPPEIRYLTNLKWLDLSSNSVLIIPPEIRHLIKLYSLKLDWNRIEIIPPEIKYLERLGVLDLASNSIEMIPHEVNDLQDHTKVILRNNKVDVVPEEFKLRVTLEYYRY